MGASSEEKGGKQRGISLGKLPLANWHIQRLSSPISGIIYGGSVFNQLANC